MKTEVLLAAITLGGLFLIMGLIWKFYPPKNINYIYGYRTRRTMANQDIWMYANKIGAKMFLFLGIVLLGVTMACFFLFPNEIIYIVLFAMLLGLGIGMVWCETQLNKRFDKNGNRKTQF